MTISFKSLELVSFQVKLHPTVAVGHWSCFGVVNGPNENRGQI